MKNRIYYLLILLVFAACQPKEESQETSENQLGQLNHQFPISEAARSDFENGLLLLHSFEYEDAREAFEAASAADKNELMAYWGEAMSHYKALWGLQDVEAGREVMARVGPTIEERLEKAENELEEDFWMGVEILYGEGELFERNKQYADHMEKLYNKYENNQEVAAFYALGLMWTIESGRNEEVFNRSAEVAAGILEENPNHPGALHYMIHAYDDPEYAKLAHKAADNYSQVAPDAAHALHMPSHIYLALGRWNDMVSSNEASYGASVTRMERKELDDAARGYHSYAWLHYGYLQQGRFEKARELLKDMQQYTESANTKSARGYLITMQNAQLVEEGQLGVEPMYVESTDLGITSRTNQLFLKAQLAFEEGDITTISNSLDTLVAYITAADLIVSDNGVALCSAGPTRYAPTRNSITRAQVAEQLMEAYIALLNEDEVKAEEAMQKAVELENQTNYSFGPPDIPYPSFEFYGDWLVSKGRYDEALAQYDLSLKRAPKRARALLAKREIYQQLDQEDKVKEVNTILSEFYQEKLTAAS